MSEPARAPERILQRLDWHVVRRLDGLLQGNYRSLFYGSGLDFADIREYQPEDDVRYIDWNVTARMEAPYVREYHEDREVSAWFLLDMSASMDFGALQTHKRAVLTDTVATLARLLTRHGNRVGAIMYGSRVERTVPARGGRMHVLRLINDMLRMPHPAPGPPTSLAGLLEAAVRSFTHRSLIFVVSDFISEPGWERPLTALARRHEVLAVRVWDPREVDLPDIGAVIMQDAETGEQLFVDTRDRGFRERFRAAALAREAETKAALGRSGVDLLAISTEEDLVRALVRFAGLRKRRVR